MSRCRRSPFKLACAERWGFGCGRVARCSGYLSPPPTRHHAQPECDHPPVTLAELQTWDSDRVWAHIASNAERALARVRVARAKAERVLPSPHGGAKKTGADN